MIRIAIVDDDEKLCSKIEQSLIAYRETTAIELDMELFYSGESFYHFLTSEHDFELIFLDIQMKSIDGVEVGHLIREKLNNNIVKDKESLINSMINENKMKKVVTLKRKDVNEMVESIISRISQVIYKYKENV